MWDSMIIGAGPAGLTAAIYLARYRRRFLVMHDERSRARWIPRTRNHPGFPAGVKGTALLSLMEQQAKRYGAEIRRGRADTIKTIPGGFAVSGTGFAEEARTVLLALGVSDLRPSIPGIEDAIRRGLVRICPICDGYEVANTRVAVLTDSDLGAAEALFLRTWTDRLTVVLTGSAEAIGPKRRAELAAQGIQLVSAAVEDIVLRPRTVELRSRPEPGLTFDHLYTAFGVQPRNALAAGVGAPTNSEGYLLAGQLHQETAVRGLYVAGDAVRGLNQISVAQAEAAIAATSIHNLLRELEREPEFAGA